MDIRKERKNKNRKKENQKGNQFSVKGWIEGETEERRNRRDRMALKGSSLLDDLERCGGR